MRRAAFIPREFAAAAAIAALEKGVGAPEERRLHAARAALAAADGLALGAAFGPASLHLDGIDASREVLAFVEGVAARMPPHPSREIQIFNHERVDGSTALFWHAERLAAAGVVARDAANRSAAIVRRAPDGP
ncbi:hypothetical protein [Methylobacterium brachiatum]